MPGGGLPGSTLPRPMPRPNVPAPGQQYRDKNGRTSSYGQTGPNGEMGYSPSDAVPAPTHYMDPNSGNNYQWDPIQGSYRLFSDANVRRGQEDANFNAHLSQFDRLSSRFPSGADGTNINATATRMPRVTLDTGAIDAGQRAAFSRAKDQVGDAQRGLMSAMKNQFASRGLRGSSIEGRAIGSGLESGFGQLADVSREQAIQGANRSVDLAKTSYGGDITQRGQDMDALSRAQSIAIQNQQAKNAALSGLWSAVSRGGGSASGGLY